jgi:hypothetical protein
VKVTSTPADALLKLYTAWTSISHTVYSDFRQTSKNVEGGLPKHILEKNTVFRKKGVEIWAFDIK